MVRVAATRQVRGGTEQYYQRTARMLDFVGEQKAATTPVFLRAVADEVATADGEPLLVLRNVRLTAAQVQQLAATLSELAGGLVDAGPGEYRYGVLLSLYRPRQADPSAG